MSYYVYCYSDPVRNERIYVGKGIGRRYKRHLDSKKKHPFIQRLQKMLRNGIEPVITFLCRDVDEELAHLVEIEAIDLYGRKDLGNGPLLNLTDGGEGHSGYVAPHDVNLRKGAVWRGKHLPLEMRLKQAASIAALPKVTCPHCSKVGSPAPMTRWHFENCKSK